VEVLVAGAKVGTFTGEVRFEAPEWAPEGDVKVCVLPPCRGSASASIVLRADAGCGPVERCVHFPQDGGAPMPPEGEPLRGVVKGRKLGPSCADDTIDVFVDNRDGPRRSLAAGKVSFRVEPGVSRIQVPAPGCDAERALAIDGEPAGSLPSFSPAASPLPHVIDPTGKRCYQRALHEYGVSGRAPRIQPFDRARLHATGPIDHFLERAPATIQTVGGIGSRTDFLEVPCADAASAPMPRDGAAKPASDDPLRDL
jgi:hypothetical protein